MNLGPQGAQPTRKHSLENRLPKKATTRESFIFQPAIHFQGSSFFCWDVSETGEKKVVNKVFDHGNPRVPPPNATPPMPPPQCHPPSCFLRGWHWGRVPLDSHDFMTPESLLLWGLVRYSSNFSRTFQSGDPGTPSMPRACENLLGNVKPQGNHPKKEA